VLWCLCCVVESSLSLLSHGQTAAFRLGPQQRQDGTRTVETDTSIQNNHQWMSQGSADGEWIGCWNGPMQQKAAKRAAVRTGEQDDRRRRSWRRGNNRRPCEPAKRGPWDHLTYAAAIINPLTVRKPNPYGHPCVRPQGRAAQPVTRRRY
jgi:hypothetical protein